MLIPCPVSLLDPGEVKERLREVITLGPLPTLDLLPRLGAVGHVVTEAEIARADRVEHPARPPLDAFGNHRNTPRAIRAACVDPAAVGARGAHGTAKDPHELSEAQVRATEAALTRALAAKGLTRDSSGKLAKAPGQDGKPGAGAAFVAANVKVYWHTITNGSQGAVGLVTCRIVRDAGIASIYASEVAHADALKSQR